MSQFPQHGTPPPGLAGWLAARDPAREPAISDVEIDGVRCIVKRRRPSVARGLSYAVRYVRALMLGVFCRLFLGEFPPPGVLLRNGLDFEADRLEALTRLGARVPAIWWRGPGVVVLEYVGEDLNGLLRHGSQAERLQLVRAAALDLAEFHRRGLWHGGAQIRNLTWHQEQIWRIDFEENIGEALSLPLAQAYDLFQALASLLALRKLPSDVMPELGSLMLDTYFSAHPDEAVRRQLSRLSRLLNLIAIPATPLLGWVPARDIQGFFRVARALRLLFKA